MKDIMVRSGYLATFFLTLLVVLTAAPTAWGQAEVGALGRSAAAKSEQAAINQALVNTVMPVALGYGAVRLINNETVRKTGALMAVYGLVMGPSTGNLYANDYLRGFLGVASRVGAVFLLQDATTEVLGSEFSGVLNVDEEPVSLDDTEILVGGILMAGTIAYNIISAKTSVREYNRQMGYSMTVERLAGSGEAVPMLSLRVNL